MLSEVIHAIFAFIGIAGVLALIWFVKENRVIALIVALCAVCGMAGAFIGIYLAVLFQHPKLVFGGVGTLVFYSLILRYLYRLDAL